VGEGRKKPIGFVERTYTRRIMTKVYGPGKKFGWGDRGKGKGSGYKNGVGGE